MPASVLPRSLKLCPQRKCAIEWDRWALEGMKSLYCDRCGSNFGAYRPPGYSPWLVIRYGLGRCVAEAAPIIYWQQSINTVHKWHAFVLAAQCKAWHWQLTHLEHEHKKLASLQVFHNEMSSVSYSLSLKHWNQF